MKLVGDVKGGEDSDLQGIYCERSGRNLAHAVINELRELRDVIAIAIGTNIVGLIINLDSNGGSRSLIHIAFKSHKAIALFLFAHGLDHLGVERRDGIEHGFDLHANRVALGKKALDLSLKPLFFVQ